MSENMPRPSGDAAFGAKAKWAILTSLMNAGPRGLTFSELSDEVQREFPDEPIYGDSARKVANISAAIQDLKRRGRVAKVDLSDMSPEQRAEKKVRWKVVEDSGAETVVEPPPAPTLKEGELYEPTVQALEGSEMCDFATTLGGALSKWEWGTPDVVGILRPSIQVRALNLPSEVVAVEVKLGMARHSLQSGCTQVANYKRFAHRVYLIVHPLEGEEIPDWLKKQCQSSGFGLCVLKLEEDGPKLQCIVDAASALPELRCLSDFVDRLPPGKRRDLRCD